MGGACGAGGGCGGPGGGGGALLLAAAPAIFTVGSGGSGGGGAVENWNRLRFPPAISTACTLASRSRRKVGSMDMGSTRSSGRFGLSDGRNSSPVRDAGKDRRAPLGLAAEMDASGGGAPV